MTEREKEKERGREGGNGGRRVTDIKRERECVGEGRREKEGKDEERNFTSS